MCPHLKDNREIASGYFLMKFASPEIAQNSSPGQFLHIKCSNLPATERQAGNHTPLLRRPFSIHNVIYKKDVIEILYKVVGKGTLCLSQKKKGEKIDCIGPLGKGFELPISNFQFPISNKTKSEIILVAGGIGVAPFFFLAERIKKSQITNHKLQIKAFLGAKTKDEILCTKELKSLGVELHIATEDGSLGYKGPISNLFKNKLSSVVPARQYLAGGCRLSSVVYACGPKGMLKEIALLSKKYQIPCQVSFEQFMGCGIGICNSCVIRTKHGYKRVCKDGPVFNAEEIDWEKI